ncbi:hypothetical protein D910_04914 [Dendroctonus ponderosae]|uniref:Innexin n=1 Tax=Dendroctonus ponderosae TaxID=77166 RepID=U4U386_DENPD|nr:hypothetical protein D910_04914 [Dendroctonus ponderosae]
MELDCCFRDVPEDVLNTFCWIHSTFTVVDASRNIVTDQAHYPGVLFTGSRPIRQVRYYQWVAFVLFFQAFNRGPILCSCLFRAWLMQSRPVFLPPPNPKIFRRPHGFVSVLTKQRRHEHRDVGWLWPISWIFDGVQLHVDAITLPAVTSGGAISLARCVRNVDQQALTVSVIFSASASSFGPLGIQKLKLGGIWDSNKQLCLILDSARQILI